MPLSTNVSRFHDLQRKVIKQLSVFISNITYIYIYITFFIILWFCFAAHSALRWMSNTESTKSHYSYWKNGQAVPWEQTEIQLIQIPREWHGMAWNGNDKEHLSFLTFPSSGFTWSAHGSLIKRNSLKPRNELWQTYFVDWNVTVVTLFMIEYDWVLSRKLHWGRDKFLKNCTVGPSDLGTFCPAVWCECQRREHRFLRKNSSWKVNPSDSSSESSDQSGCES